MGKYDEFNIQIPRRKLRLMNYLLQARFEKLIKSLADPV